MVWLSAHFVSRKTSTFVVMWRISYPPWVWLLWGGIEMVKNGKAKGEDIKQTTQTHRCHREPLQLFLMLVERIQGWSKQEAGIKGEPRNCPTGNSTQRQPPDASNSFSTALEPFRERPLAAVREIIMSSLRKKSEPRYRELRKELAELRCRPSDRPKCAGKSSPNVGDLSRQ